jgi:hypothetical protein
MSTITFRKRQKEMKRLEKQRMKRERREQKKLAQRAERVAAESGDLAVSAEPLADAEPEDL